MNDDTASATPSSAARNQTEQAISSAIRWMVMLRSGEATERDRQRFEAWCNAAPAHATGIAIERQSKSNDGRAEQIMKNGDTFEVGVVRHA